MTVVFATADRETFQPERRSGPYDWYMTPDLNMYECACDVDLKTIHEYVDGEMMRFQCREMADQDNPLAHTALKTYTFPAQLCRAFEDVRFKSGLRRIDPFNPYSTTNDSSICYVANICIKAVYLEPKNVVLFDPAETYEAFLTRVMQRMDELSVS